jgi:putative acyl-CoA dehydrogenase
MCDAFLTLGNTSKGPTCFLVPRWLAPGVRNKGLRFQQLKNKLGDKSNASSEVEYNGAIGYALGHDGQGVKAIITMVNHTRLDCLIGSAALMSISLLSAMNHTNHRSAFGSRLIETPVMQNVLCDLALESEAATALAMRVSSTFDRHPDTLKQVTPLDAAFQRISCAIAKYHICKLAPNFVYECLECHGGNGYVEDFPLARHFRQSPLNAIWEGSGNVIVLDLFRAMQKEPLAIPALAEEVKRSQDPILSDNFAQTMKLLKASSPDDAFRLGRLVIERLAVILEGAALRQFGPKYIADWFIDTRVRQPHGRHYGAISLPSSDITLPKTAVQDLLSRHL